MYNAIFDIISKAKCDDLEESLSKIREEAGAKIDDHTLSGLLKSYDDINISIKKLINQELINQEIETQQINNVLSDFFNKICEYFEQKLSKGKLGSDHYP